MSHKGEQQKKGWITRLAEWLSRRGIGPDILTREQAIEAERNRQARALATLRMLEARYKNTTRSGR